jgi:transcriptional regulator with XRE-family HTH domain
MADSSANARKSTFGRNLCRARIEKGWNQSDLARAAAAHLPAKRFGRDNISKYEKGATFPTPLHMHALERALGRSLDDEQPIIDDRLAEAEIPLSLRSTKPGMAWLQINQEVNMVDALEVLSILSRKPS